MSERRTGHGMIPEIDIWRCAQLMVRQYGGNAVAEAEKRAGELIEKGDAAGGAVWRRICQAVAQLQNKDPNGAVH